jgi:hypothetical protein
MSATATVALPTKREHPHCRSERSHEGTPPVENHFWRNLIEPEMGNFAGRGQAARVAVGCTACWRVLLAVLLNPCSGLVVLTPTEWCMPSATAIGFPAKMSICLCGHVRFLTCMQRRVVLGSTEAGGATAHKEISRKPVTDKCNLYLV